MIAYLSGRPLVSSALPIILCGGVGYGVHLTLKSQQHILGKEQVDLYVYTHVKEDAIELFGFLSEGEKQLFMKLINVDGVGPKTALNIMERGSDEIVRAIQHADVSFFQSVPRVGKKSAQKIIIELKNKLGGTMELDLVEPEGKAKDVVEALISLGFSETEGTRVVKSIDIEDIRVEDAVKKAIQLLTMKS